MIESVFQQAPFDEKIDGEIIEKIGKEYLDFKYMNQDRCGKCGKFDKGVYRIKDFTFVCRTCLFKENIERRFNEERSKLE